MLPSLSPPRAFVLLILPDKVLLHRYALPLSGQARLKATASAVRSAERSLAVCLQEVTGPLHPGADDIWFVGLPLKHFTTVNFSLPLAAQANLDQAVRYGLMRHVPFDPTEAHVHSVSRAEGDKLQITATLALREQLQPILEALAGAGIVLSAVAPALALTAWANGRDGLYVCGGAGETELLAWKEGRVVFQAWDAAMEPQAGARFLARARQLADTAPQAPKSPLWLWETRLPAAEVAGAMAMPPESIHEIHEPPATLSPALEGFAYQIDFVPPEVLARRKRAVIFQAVAAALLVLALAAYPLAGLVGKQRLLHHLDERIATLTNQTGDLTALRRQNQERLVHLKKMAEYVSAQPFVGEYLKEATELLPNDVWLQSFIFSERQIAFQGVSHAAATVMETLENSPLFKDVHFDAPVNKSGDNELFTLVAKME